MSQAFPAGETPAETDSREPPNRSEQELLATLFDLGRQVTAVLDLDGTIKGTAWSVQLIALKPAGSTPPSTSAPRPRP